MQNAKEFISEQMVALFAPDGTFQAMTLAPDFATCAAIIKMMHKGKLGRSFHELVVVRGFQILPVEITMKVVGTHDEAFFGCKKS